MPQLQLFMIKTGQLEVISKPIFTKGDSYLVVDQAAKKIYIWLGSKCSVDEKGVAAVEARRIDDGQVFNGSAKIITYDEGDEDPEFLAKLGGLKVLDKNLAKSMLKDVNTGEFAGQAEHIVALYRISSEEFEGINAMKFIQVPFEKESLDPEDCFIADLGVDIWVWQGSQSNIKEKVKAGQWAREFDAERAGAQRPKIFMDGDDDAEFLDIFEKGVMPAQDRETVNLQAEHFEEGAQTTPVVPAPVTSQKAESAPPVNNLLTQTGDGRLTCPKCGNSKNNMIREIEDRTNIIMDYPLLYGKKFICGECGAEWRRKTN